jgi:mono/diheme cytochrome c family protein
MLKRIILMAVLAGSCFAPLDAGQSKAKDPTVVILPMYGRGLYEMYCATCHGLDGKGNGPVVPALKVRPADLTTIGRRNGGTFPKDRIEAFVTIGDQAAVPAHGSKTMPVWGPIFSAVDPSDTAIKTRVLNIVEYVESLQIK